MGLLEGDIGWKKDLTSPLSTNNNSRPAARLKPAEAIKAAVCCIAPETEFDDCSRYCLCSMTWTVIGLSTGGGAALAVHSVSTGAGLIVAAAIAAGIEACVCCQGVKC